MSKQQLFEAVDRSAQLRTMHPIVFKDKKNIEKKLSSQEMKTNQ